MTLNNYYKLKISPPGTDSVKKIMNVLCGTITNFNICLIVPSPLDFHYENMVKSKPAENTLRLVYYKELKDDSELGELIVNDDDFINKYKNTLFVSAEKSATVAKFYERVKELVSENEYRIIHLSYT